MGKYWKVAFLGMSAVLTLSACSDLTERETDVTVELDTFNLIGTGEANGILARATVSGNPACTASQTSINTLLAQVDNFDDIDEFLDSLDLNAIRYRIPTNNTPVAASGVMQMTDPVTGGLVTVASVALAANETVPEWTNFPFAEGGAAIVNNYLDNRDSMFLYCMEGSPNSADLTMTFELELDMTVTVDLL